MLHRPMIGFCKNGEWANLVQSYLACVSFVDAQVERVVKAIEASAYKDNTYIVLFSDHGFHLEKRSSCQAWPMGR